MAIRPVFFHSDAAGGWVRSRPIKFEWFPGYSISQKQRSIRSLHRACAQDGFSRVLEVSSKSECEIGQRLSAFSLRIVIGGRRFPLESVYQGAKVFERGGPFPELFDQSPRDAKRYLRGADLGSIKEFRVFNSTFENEPRTAFYDWIYMRSLKSHLDFLRDHVFVYDAFTDIEFNPEKSLNSQARSIALMKGLFLNGELKKALEDYQWLRNIESKSV